MTPKIRSGLSLRAKVVLIATCTTAVTVLICGCLLAGNDLAGFRGQISRDLQIDAKMLGSNIAAPLVFSDLESANEVLTALKSNDRVQVAAVYDAHGKLFAQYRAPLTAETAPALSPSWTSGISSDGFSAMLRVDHKGESVGTVYVRGSEAEFFAKSREYFAAILSLLVAAILISTIIAWRLQRLISQPITRLIEGIAEIGERKDYSVRIVTHRQDEIGMLVESFNLMLAEVESRDQDLESRVAERTDALSAEIKTREAAEGELSVALHRANSASAAKSQFVATMSHELRTPMNGVLGMTEVLLDTNLSKTQAGYAKTIQSSANALLDIINAVLDFSKADAGKLQLHCGEVDLSGIVADIGDLLAYSAQEKEIDLICWCDADVPATVSADGGRLRQILMNLVGNAIKFTDAGEVLLHIGVSAQEEGRASLKITVKDSGIGISTDKQSAVFESFTQVDGGASRRQGGAGLGLAICRQLVDLMDGSISVVSEFGSGSTFIVELEVPVVDEAARIDLSGKNVLIALSSPTQSALLVESFSKAGATVTTARSSGWIFDFDFSKAFDLSLVGLDFVSESELTLAFARLKTFCLATLAKVGTDDGVQPKSTATVHRQFKSSVLPQELFSLLEHKTNAAPTSVPSDLHVRGNAVRVLVIDDQAINRMVASRLLEQLGCKVTLAESGFEALDRLKSQAFEIIFTDVQMPELNGYDLTARIRREFSPDIALIPIVAMTANAMEGDRDRCLAAGMDDYISKPISKCDLLKIIDRWSNCDALYDLAA